MNIVTVYWILLGVLFTSWAISVISLYRQGQYIKKRYPDRYEKQLSNHDVLQFNKAPFPFNFGWLTGWTRYQGAYGYYDRQFKKIIDIANAENDANLLKRAEHGRELGHVAMNCIFWALGVSTLIWLLFVYL